jgi:hypothetical protein
MDSNESRALAHGRLTAGPIGADRSYRTCHSIAIRVEVREEKDIQRPSDREALRSGVKKPANLDAGGKCVAKSVTEMKNPGPKPRVFTG